MSILELCYDQEDNESPINPSPKEVKLRKLYADAIKIVASKMINNVDKNSSVYDRSININGVTRQSKILYIQANYDDDDTSSSLNLLPTGEIIDVMYNCDDVGKYQRITDWSKFLDNDSSIYKCSKNLKYIYKEIVKITTDFNISQSEIDEWNDKLKMDDPNFLN